MVSSKPRFGDLEKSRDHQKARPSPSFDALEARYRDFLEHVVQDSQDQEFGGDIEVPVMGRR